MTGIISTKKFTTGWHFNSFEPPTLSAHDQIKCQAFIAAIEAVEKEFGMRLATNERRPIKMKYDGDFERRVDEKGRVYATDNAPWKSFINVELGKSWDEHCKNWPEDEELVK